jgi:predicted ATPase
MDANGISPSLTKLGFKNWRSLKDVEINFSTPITVFIGANSSGKTNIIDGLHFLRNMVQSDTMSGVGFRIGREKIRTLGTDESDPIEIKMSFQPAKAHHQFTYVVQLETLPKTIQFREEIADSTRKTHITAINGATQDALSFIQVKHDPALYLRAFGQKLFDGSTQANDPTDNFAELFAFAAYRWQLLSEGFMPLLRSAIEKRAVEYFSVADDASNMIDILEFMQERHPEIYTDFQINFVWLLHHVEKLRTEQSDYETRLVIEENTQGLGEAPTISAGTARLAAILTAVHALDMRYRELPGLIIIEEPDTALNPGLLRNFVEQLRNYASGEYPRQFILTTHNPSFLNYFQPEEVRVVERDERGYTTVHPIPDHVRDIWLDEYDLGEVWFTNSFGGLPK